MYLFFKKSSSWPKINSMSVHDTKKNLKNYSFVKLLTPSFLAALTASLTRKTKSKNKWADREREN